MDGATSTIIELISEDHDASESSSGVAKIRITSGIHRELIEFVKKKVIDSIELQQFIVSREIEFYEKYVDYLTKHQSSYNNHNELDELQEASLNPEQRIIELSDAKSTLEGLRKRCAALGKREQKACDSLSSGFKELKIMNSPSSTSETLKYQVTNSEWSCTLNNSISLQKIKMICEKLTRVSMKMEVSFWITEVGNLIEKLRSEEKEVAFGIIVEMVTCPFGDCSNENLLTLVNTLIEKKEAKEHIFSNVNKWKAVSNETLTIEQYMWNVKVLAALFTVADQISQEKFKQNICELMIKTLENNELEVNHLMGIITIFESVGPKLGNVLDRFDRIFSLFNAKSHILQSSDQYRITQLMRFRSITSPLLDTPIIAAASLPRASSIRNITIIEHSETSQYHMKTPEELERELRLKIAEEMRIEADRKKKEEEMIEEIRLKVREELMMEEKRKQEERERKARRELEDATKAEALRLEKQRKIEEEDRKKKELEDARKAEELRIKKQKEEEDRKKVEEEKKQRAKAIQDAQKAEQLRIQRQREEYERNNPCTFITAGTRMYRHTDPGHHYERDNLDGKLIGLLFSGSWCQPCLNFVPYLRDFHCQVEDDFEVVFISSDRSEQEMNSFLENYHGDWFNLPFRTFEGDRLKSMLGVQSIPTLIVLKPNGNYQNVNWTNEVMNCQNPQQLINQWKKM